MRKEHEMPCKRPLSPSELASALRHLRNARRELHAIVPLLEATGHSPEPIEQVLAALGKIAPFLGRAAMEV